MNTAFVRLLKRRKEKKNADSTDEEDNVDESRLIKDQALDREQTEEQPPDDVLTVDSTSENIKEEA